MLIVANHTILIFRGGFAADPVVIAWNRAYSRWEPGTLNLYQS